MTIFHRSSMRLGIGVCINLGVALLHVLDIAALLPLNLQRLHRSYFSDCTIPFAFYYLLCLVDDRSPRLRSSGVKALTVLAGATSAEFCQGLGIPLLGRTFDPWDVAMYAAGVSLAALVDSCVLSRWVRHWSLGLTSSGPPSSAETTNR